MVLCVAFALFVPLGLNGGQVDSGVDEKGGVRGILINADTGAPIAEQILYLFKFFSKTDDGKPFEMVMFARDAPSMTTNTSGAFKFGDVPVMSLNSRLNKERQKYTLGLGIDRRALKNPDGSILLFEIKPDGVVDLGKRRVKK